MPGKYGPARLWSMTVVPTGLLPGTTQVGGRGAGQAELGVGGKDQPGPDVGCLWAPDFGTGPAEGLFEQAECVFDVEAAQEGLPEPVDVSGGGIDAGAGQVADLEADDVPSMIGSVFAVLVQAFRWVNRGCSRFQARAHAVP